MNERRYHWLEKLQVQVAVAAVLAIAYFLFWPLVRPDDPQGPLVFLSSGEIAKLLKLALLFWGVTVFAAALTSLSKLEGAMAALLLGFGGLSLHSEPLLDLVWYRQGSTGKLFTNLIVELLVLVAFLLVADLLLAAVRVTIGRINPRLVKSSSPPGSETSAETGPSKPRLVENSLLLQAAVSLAKRSPLARQPASPKGKDQKKTLADLPLLPRTALFFAVAFVIAAVLMGLLLQSSQRGQVIFSVLVSCFLGVLAAQYIVPASLSGVALLVPVVLAVVYYVLAAMSPLPQVPQGWLQLSFYAGVLPIDWLTAGCGGAALGYWTFARVMENQRLEKIKEQGNQS